MIQILPMYQVHFMTTPSRIPFNLTALMNLLADLTLVTLMTKSSRMLYYRLNGVLVLWQLKHSISLDVTQIHCRKLATIRQFATQHWQPICPTYKASNSPNILLK